VLFNEDLQDLRFPEQFYWGFMSSGM